jgi:transposase-like protein
LDEVSIVKDDFMDFPLQDFLDENACYAKLVQLLHPEGLSCPRCQSRTGLNIHRRDRDPIVDYRCRCCGRVFNAFTGTVLEKTPKKPSQVMLILRGIAQGTSTARLARELGLERTALLDFRHRLQGLAEQFLDQTPLADGVAESDEMYQNAGEKRHFASRSR